MKDFQLSLSDDLPLRRRGVVGPPTRLSMHVPASGYCAWPSSFPGLQTWVRERNGNYSVQHLWYLRKQDLYDPVWHTNVVSEITEWACILGVLNSYRKSLPSTIIFQTYWHAEFWGLWYEARALHATEIVDNDCALTFWWRLWNPFKPCCFFNFAVVNFACRKHLTSATYTVQPCDLIYVLLSTVWLLHVHMLYRLHTYMPSPNDFIYFIGRLYVKHLALARTVT